MRFTSLMIVFIALILLPLAISGHVPLTGNGNDSLETAAFISDPIKSWAIYSELHESRAHYYRINMEEGQTLYVSLFIPTIAYKEGFMPGIILFGPGFDSHDRVPSFVEVPSGAEALVVEGELPTHATYEPFTPSSLYELAEVRYNISTSGTYHIVVYEPVREGHYGLAIGYREAFTLKEWVLVPISTIVIHQWEGQPLSHILAPLLATLVIGFGLLFLRIRTRRSYETAFCWAGSAGGLLFLGSAAISITQMIVALKESSPGPEIIVTIIFILLPIILGILVLRMALRDTRDIKIKKRVAISLIGFIGIFVWGGLIIGPSLAILASVLPTGPSRK